MAGKIDKIAEDFKQREDKAKAAFAIIALSLGLGLLFSAQSDEEK